LGAVIEARFIGVSRGEKREGRKDEQRMGDVIEMKGKEGAVIFEGR
jgi:hypothetical protein